MGMLLGVLGSVALLASWGDRAVAHAASPTVVEACGPAQWVLSGATPIGSTVVGSTVQTLVLRDDATLALTGACPAIAAKVKSTAHGTVVKALWSSGLCGGVSGTARLAATIDATCATVHGKFAAHEVRRTFDATRSPCDVTLLDSGGMPRCVVRPVDPGTASTRVTLDHDGCVGADLALPTTTGISAVLHAGSCLRTAAKRPLHGDVEVAVDDAGGAPGGAGVEGIVRLRVRPKGRGAPVVVDVDPPATLALPLGDFSLAGTWYTAAFLGAGGVAATPLDTSLVLLDAVPIVDAGPEQVREEFAGPLGLVFEPVPAAVVARAHASPRAAGSSTVTFLIPADAALPDPRVETWTLVNPKTAQIIVAGATTGALAVGDSDVRVRQGHTFTATLLETSGQRRVEVTSNFSNRFSLELGLHDGTNGNTSTVGGDASGGCADETCLGDVYVGLVRVEARVRSFPEAVMVRDTIAAHVPAGVRVVLHAVTAVSGGSRAVLSIFGLDASVRSIMGLPTSWAVSASDRLLSIDTHPANVLGEWQGTMSITFPGSSSFDCPPTDPLCARLTVQTGPAGLRVAYCNDQETLCSGSAATSQCSLLFDGAAGAGGFTATGVDNNSPCCIGCVGQNRVYGCVMTATVTTDRRGQQTLEATFPGSVTSCPSEATDFGVTHLRMCRPKPCAVP